MAVVRINEFIAAPGKSDELRAFLLSIIGLITGSAGSRRVDLVVSRDDSSTFVILEEWDSVEAHQAAAKLVPTEKVAQVMPLLAVPVKGAYYDRLD
jgi:heme oxygenase (mycobilin-producing)